MSSASQAPRILVVDDDEGLLILMAEALRADGFDVATADSGGAAVAWLEQNSADLMLLDLKLQDVSGPALVQKLRRRDVAVPYIVVTGQGDEKVAVDVMKQGALDYVMKDTGMIDLLPTIVRRALERVAQDAALASARAEQMRLEGEIVAVSERERHSIGADLHDGLGQQLTAIELMCAALKEDAQGQPTLARGLDQMGRMLREAVMQTRFLARGLVPVGTDPEALPIGLAELAERTNALARVRCRFESPQPVRIDDRHIAGQLYRIAQEAVNNAIKHAGAKSITIRLAREPGALVLEVRDDGTGITANDGPRTGLGLGVMQHRAKLIGAELTIRSKKGGGVTIRCCLPMRK